MGSVQPPGLSRPSRRTAFASSATAFRASRRAVSAWRASKATDAAGRFMREDASEIRTGHSPENMATLRSFAINELRDAGHTNIAAGLRTTALRPYERPLALLGLN